MDPTQQIVDSLTKIEAQIEAVAKTPTKMVEELERLQSLRAEIKEDIATALIDANDAISDALVDAFDETVDVILEIAEEEINTLKRQALLAFGALGLLHGVLIALLIWLH